uniref:Uncharacterized protein n=1 Tax=Leersia perrieri TaxID=77586 RepID=A0A0D9XK74_9ORYZ
MAPWILLDGLPAATSRHARPSVTITYGFTTLGPNSREREEGMGRRDQGKRRHQEAAEEDGRLAAASAQLGFWGRRKPSRYLHRPLVRWTAEKQAGPDEPARAEITCIPARRHRLGLAQKGTDASPHQPLCCRA